MNLARPTPPPSRKAPIAAAVGIFQWFVNNWLQIAALLVLVGVILKATGKI